MKDLISYISTIELKDNGTSVVEVLRVGTIRDRDLKITKKMLEQFVENFKKNVYGTEIQVNLQHNRGDEAAGWVKDVFIDDDKLFAKIEWTDMGKEKISKRLFKFVSAELAGRFPHHKTGKLFSNVFIGLALTNTPALKAQNALALSEQVNKLLTNTRMFVKILNKLKERVIVSKEDKELLKEAYEELSDEEKEEHKEGVAEVEAKPEEKVVTEEEKKVAEEKEVADKKAAEEKEAAEKKEEEGEEEEKKTAEELSEKLDESNQEIADLKEKVETNELNEEFADTMALSEKKDVGFLEKSKDEVVKFMLKLSDEMRKEFKDLVGKIKHVDLKTHGSTSGGDAHANNENAVMALAEKLLKDGKTKDIGEAQKMATEQLAKK